MKKYGLFCGLLLGALLMASQALAATVGTPSGIAAPPADSDGSYKVTLGASTTIDCTYEVYENNIKIYSGLNRSFLVTGRTAGSYAYKANAIKAGLTDSAYTVTVTTAVTGNGLVAVATPSGISSVAQDIDGNFSVSIGSSSTLDALYTFEESIDGGAWGIVQAASASRMYGANGKPSGKRYSYRAYASKAGMNNSAPTAVVTTYVASSDFCVSCHDGSVAADTATAWAGSRHGNSNATPGVLSNSCSQCHAPTNELAGVNMAITCLGCHTFNGTDGTGHPAVSTRTSVTSCANCHDSHYSVGNIATKVAASKHHVTPVTETAGHNTGSCQRCHTLEGYLNYAGTGLAFDAYAPTFTAVTAVQNVSCAACHDPHTAALRTTPGWNVGSAQYNICTSCHNLTNATGTPIASGLAVGPTGAQITTVAMQQHYKDWYRNITSTHFDLARTGYGLKLDDAVTAAPTTVEGYVVRKNRTSACTDCHGHEFLTETDPLVSSNPMYDSNGDSIDDAYYKTTIGGASNLSVYSLNPAPEETIHNEWAKSGHAGKLLTKKIEALVAATGANTVTGYKGSDPTPYTFPSIKRDNIASAAVMSAGVTPTSGPAWEHYDWDKTYKADGTDTDTDPDDDRAQCQRCHTATGSANFLTDPVAYNPVNNDFSHLSGWVGTPGTKSITVGSGQNEVLYCWGCHNSVETGELHNPGALTLEYNFKGVKAVMPNVGSSNVCFSCHAGRVGGEDITALTTAANTFTNVGFKNSHYMAAAGLMYAKIGYTNFIDPATVIGTSTYGKSLTTPEDGGLLTSTHRKLGTAAIVGDHGITAADNLDTDGPCVACHYANGSHAIEMDANAFNTVCVKCHTAEGTTTLTAANFKTVFIEEQAVPFEDALTLAKTKLQANYGIIYDPARNPYFFVASAPTVAVTNWTTGGGLATPGLLAATPLSAAEAEKLMGACFNINVLARDPAAFAHARTYTRRLIYDSIDFIDDKTINMSTGATAIATDPVKYVKGALANSVETTEAFKYLAGYNRTSGIWNALERP